MVVSSLETKSDEVVKCTHKKLRYMQIWLVVVDLVVSSSFIHCQFELVSVNVLSIAYIFNTEDRKSMGYEDVRMSITIVMVHY
jgi:hypothetical protein